MSDEPAPRVNRVPLSLKIPPGMRAQLLAAAESKGRSLTQETEYRLQQSLDREEMEQALRRIVREEVRNGSA